MLKLDHCACHTSQPLPRNSKRNTLLLGCRWNDGASKRSSQLSSSVVALPEKLKLKSSWFQRTIRPATRSMKQSHRRYESKSLVGEGHSKSGSINPALGSCPGAACKRPTNCSTSMFVLFHTCTVKLSPSCLRTTPNHTLLNPIT